MSLLRKIRTFQLTTTGLRIIGMLFLAAATYGTMLQTKVLGIGYMNNTQLLDLLETNPEVMSGLSLAMVMQLIGACALPVFVFLLVEGATHTSHYGKYLLRVLGLAVACQLPYNMITTGSTMYMTRLNPVFAMFMCLVMLYFFRSFTQKNAKHILIKVIAFIGVYLWSNMLGVERGACCVILCVVMWALRGKQNLQTFIGILVMFGEKFIGMFMEGELTAQANADVSPEELAERRAFDEIVRSIDDVGDYVPEEEDPNVLIYGPWLERGGSAFWVSTAGTGKSIGSFQLAHAMSMGRPFCGLRPRGRLKFWIFQSEDSERRNAQDRIDVRAELVELYGDEDTAEAWRGIKLIKLTGKVGTEFLAELDKLLGQAEGYGVQPDVIILNPFLAFVGGPITDGAYVTPFLRGGVINHAETKGLQFILEKHGCALLAFHHTPKPPTEKELDGWMKATFPV